MCKKVILIGAGGHGKVIADIIEKCGDKLVGFLDDNAHDDAILGYPILGKAEDCVKYTDCEFLISIGNNAVRKRIAEKYNFLNYYTAIHPTAVIANSAKIDCGSCVMANAVVNASATIGKHCIINTCASVDHDCIISNYVHISPNAVLCGNVKIGEQTHIGAGTVVKNNITITEKITVGVGAAVVKDLKNSGVYVGVPARENVNDMKKICYVTTISMTLKAFVLDTAKYLYENGGYDISFICNYDEEFADSLPEYIHYYPVTMERGISIGGLKAMIEIKEILKREKFDIVQYSTPNASCYTALASALVRVPVRLYCQWGIAYVGFSGIKKQIFKFEEKIVCKLSTWVEPDSFGNLKFSHSEKLYPCKKGSVIWNGSASGVNTKKFNKDNKDIWRSEIRKKYNIPCNAKVFIFVGRVTRDKGINELFAATRKLIEKYDDMYLMMVGPNENEGSVNEELYEWSIKNEKVIYCGFTNEVEKYLSAGDVYVLPSYREGFGSAVIEAEAMGLPVIVSDIPGPTDAMKKNYTGLVVAKGSVKELENAMYTLYNDDNLKREYGKNAYEFAVDNFEQEKLFEKILLDRNKLIKEN